MCPSWAAGYSLPCLPRGLGSHICGRRDRDVVVALGGPFVEVVRHRFLLSTYRLLQLLE